KEYDNPEFADFLRMLGAVISAAQAAGDFTPSIPPHIAARMIFGVLDELALAWVLGRRSQAAAGGSGPGTRPKKFDLVRAADWIITLVTTGLEQPKEPA